MKRKRTFYFICTLFTCLSVPSKVKAAIYNAVEEDSVILQNITVLRNRVISQSDGYVINLNHSPELKGKHIPDIMNMLPAVYLQDGTIYVSGTPVSIIYVNGVKLQNQEELKTLPAEYIRKIKVRYLRGSDENAKLQGGVLEITMKEPPKGGFYGNTSASADYLPYYGYGGSTVGNILNYRIGNVSFYNNLYFRRYEAIGDTENASLIKGSKDYLSSEDAYRNWKNTFSDRLSITGRLSEHQTLGLSSMFMKSAERPETNSIGIDEQGTFHDFVSGKKNFIQWQGTLLYNIETAKGGRFSFSTDYIYYNEQQKQQINSTDHSVTNQENTQANKMLDMRASYSFKVFKNDTFQAGLVYYLNHSDYQVDDLSKEKSTLTWKMPAAFVTWSGVLNRLNYTAGLRYQYSSKAYKEAKDYHYTSHEFCPTLTVSYMFNSRKQHSIGLTYSRSVDDLPYSVLSSSRNYENGYSYTIGNGSLIAGVSDYIRFYVMLFNNAFFSASFGNDSHPIYFISRPDEENTNSFYTTPVNGKFERTLTFSGNVRLKPFSWWKVVPNIRWRFYWVNTPDFVQNGRSSVYCSLSNYFTFKHDFGGAIEGYYDGSAHYWNRYAHNVYQITGNMYKDFFKGKLELGLNFTLYRHGRWTEIDSPFLYRSIRNVTHEQYAGFSITWFFNGGKQVQVDRTDGIQNRSLIEDKR